MSKLKLLELRDLKNIIKIGKKLSHEQIGKILNEMKDDPTFVSQIDNSLSETLLKFNKLYGDKSLAKINYVIREYHTYSNDNNKRSQAIPVAYSNGNFMPAQPAVQPMVQPAVQPMVQPAVQPMVQHMSTNYTMSPNARQMQGMVPNPATGHVVSPTGSMTDPNMTLQNKHGLIGSQQLKNIDSGSMGFVDPMDAIKSAGLAAPVPVVPNGMPGTGMSGMSGMPSTGMPGIPGMGMSGMPGMGMPGTGIPGTGIPGMGMPGTGIPGMGMPGTGIPGMGMPGMGMPGMPGTGIPGMGMPGMGMPGMGMPGMSGMHGMSSMGQFGGGVTEVNDGYKIELGENEIGLTKIPIMNINSNIKLNTNIPIFNLVGNGFSVQDNLFTCEC
jgi:hypothetical protein